MAIRHLHIARRSSSGLALLLALAAAEPAWAAQGPAADAAGGQEEAEGDEVVVTGYPASLAIRGDRDGNGYTDVEDYLNEPAAG